MAYCASADVQKAVGGADKLIQLADQDGDGVADVAVIDAVIAEADALIDSHVERSGRHVPLATVPRLVQDLSARLAAHALRESRGAITEAELEIHKLRLATLENIALRKVSLGVDPEPGKSDGIRSVCTDRDLNEDLDVRRETLKGFW